jgi:hypothetical protein
VNSFRNACILFLQILWFNIHGQRTNQSASASWSRIVSGIWEIPNSRRQLFRDEIRCESFPSKIYLTRIVLSIGYSLARKVEVPVSSSPSLNLHFWKVYQFFLIGITDNSWSNRWISIKITFSELDKILHSETNGLITCSRIRFSVKRNRSQFPPYSFRNWDLWGLQIFQKRLVYRCLVTCWKYPIVGLFLFSSWWDFQWPMIRDLSWVKSKSANFRWWLCGVVCSGRNLWKRFIRAIVKGLCTRWIDNGVRILVRLDSYHKNRVKLLIWVFRHFRIFVLNFEANHFGVTFQRAKTETNSKKLLKLLAV